MCVNIVTWHISVSLYLFRCHRTPSGASISAKKAQMRQICRNVVYIICSVRGEPAFAGVASLPDAIFDLFTRMCEDKEISSQWPDDGQTQHWRLFSHELCVHFNHESDTSWAVKPPPSAGRWEKGMKAKPETNDIRVKPRHESLKTSQSRCFVQSIIAPYGTHLDFGNEKRHSSTNSTNSTCFRRKYRRVVRLYLRQYVCLSS